MLENTKRIAKIIEIIESNSPLAKNKLPEFWDLQFILKVLQIKERCSYYYSKFQKVIFHLYFH